MTVGKFIIQSMKKPRINIGNYICVSILALIYCACGNTTPIENSSIVNTSATPNAKVAAPVNNALTINEPKPSKPPSNLENVSREIFNKSFHPKTENSPIPQPSKNPENSIATRPAPDNSEIYPAMNAANQPMDVRVYKNNSFLVKMERIYISEKEKEIKIYLKNGKTVTVTEDKIPDFAVASISSILRAADFIPQ